MKYEDLKNVNDKLKTVPIQNKDYVEVNTRVLAFRELFPMGAIETEIVSLENGVCVMRSRAMDENGQLLSTGYAYEKEGSSFINKTSYIENCETSSVGRCLGFLGIGIDTSIASVEEVQNAQEQQKDTKTKAQVQKVETVSKAQKQGLMSACKELDLNLDGVLSQVGWEKGKDFTKEMYGKAMNVLIEERKKKNADVHN